MLGTIQRGKSRKKKLETCSAMSAGKHCCFITEADVNLTLVQCDRCEQWFHTMCEGITPADEVTLAQDDYTCVQCHIDSEDGLPRCDVFEAQIAQLIQAEENHNSQLVDASINVDDLKAKHKAVVGSRERALVDALENMKVVRQAYHGNVMVGNHCVIVLQRYTELTAVISDQPIHRGFNEVFKLFSDAMTLIMARRFLSNEEVAKLTKLCHRFGEVFPVHFPERNIIRKIHELVFNVPIFVEVHRTIGMLSEQEGESKHASVNAELRSLACVRDTNPSGIGERRTTFFSR